MSIKGWTEKEYAAAVDQYARLSKWLLENYITADWSKLRPAKDRVEELGGDIEMFEKTRGLKR